MCNIWVVFWWPWWFYYKEHIDLDVEQLPCHQQIHRGCHIMQISGGGPLPGSSCLACRLPQNTNIRLEWPSINLGNPRHCSDLPTPNWFATICVTAERVFTAALSGEMVYPFTLITGSTLADDNGIRLIQCFSSGHQNGTPASNCWCSIPTWTVFKPCRLVCIERFRIDIDWLSSLDFALCGSHIFKTNQFSGQPSALS